MTEPAVTELREVSALMSEYRIDSVKMPSGLEVIKTTHAPLDSPPPAPEHVEEAVQRRLEALGLINATDESGRLAVDLDEVQFAASRMPALELSQFRPAAPGEEPPDGDDQ